MHKVPLYLKEYVGHRYNDWEIISTDIKYKDSRHRPYFLCRCRCEYCSRPENSPCEKLIRYYNLRSGATRSCGRSYSSKIIKQYNKIKEKKKNDYDLSGDFGIGFFEARDHTLKEFYFDKEDFEIIKPYTWRVDRRGYVVTQQASDKTCISMHRLIMGVNDKNVQVDHINHIPFDNRRSNIRTCSSYENLLNRENSNYLRGHGIERQGNRYIVRFRRNGVRYYWGSFINYQDALNKRIQMEPDASSEFQYEVNKLC